MEIEISNKISIRNAPNSIMDELIGYLTIKNPKYEEALNQGKKGWGIDQFIHNFNYIHCGIEIPRGCKQRLFDLVKTENITDIEIIDNRTKFEWCEIESNNIIYRSYQSEPMSKFTTKEEGLLIAPGGSGKTVMGISLVPLLGQPTLWLTHTDRLAKQTKERAEYFLPSLKDEVGAIGAGKWAIGKTFTIGMIQTLVRNEEKLKSIRDMFGLVIVDEVHHCPCSTFLKVINKLNPFYLFGLTATPYRRDKLEIIMFQSIGEAVATIDAKEVEKCGGIMIPTVRYRSIRSKNIEGNNIQRIIKEHIVYNKGRNNTVVGDVIKEASLGNYCIVISDRKVHCEILFDLISIGWKKTGIATGDYTVKVRDEQVKRFYDNEITVLVTTFSLLGEGFDVDFLNRAFITTPFRAEGKVEQLVARIQRTAEGKIDAIVYDYVDINIGVVKDQFFSKKSSRYRTYRRLGMQVEPY